MDTILFVVAALVIIGVALFVYFDQPEPVQAAGVDWLEFGQFFGGVVGPLLSFLVIVMLMRYTRTQKHELQALLIQGRQENMLRYLHRLDDDIAHLLSRDLLIEGQQGVEMGDYITGMATLPAELEPHVRACLEQFLRLTANYCEALGTYRKELGEHFVFQVHEQRAREMLGALEKSKDQFPHITRQTISFCKMHLDGKKPTDNKKSLVGKPKK